MSEKNYIYIWNKLSFKKSSRLLLYLATAAAAVLSGIILLLTVNSALKQSGTKALVEGISSSVIRLHIVANSDTEADQSVKLKVRDAINIYLAPLLEEAESQAEAYLILKKELNNLEYLTDSVLLANGFSYCSEAELGDFSFPEKQYGDMHMPAGIYEALRIELGTASGHNWWCVVFPGLCFVDETTCTVPADSQQKLEELLTDEEYDYLFCPKKPVTFRFYIWDKLCELFSGF